MCSEGYNCVVYLDLLTPLRGQLEATLISNPAAGPPLSVVKAMIVLFNISLLCKASTTLPIDASKCAVMAKKKVANYLTKKIFKSRENTLIILLSE